MKTFFQTLNSSPWQGVISEVGLGLEFSSSLLRVPGASQTVIQANCDYAGLDKPTDMRAASLANARRMAHQNLNIAKSNVEHYEPTNHRFGLAITGAHYQTRDSHGWIYVMTEEWEAYMHFSISVSNDREWIGKVLTDRVIWFLNGLFLSNNVWARHIEDISDSLETHNIDVLYGPGIGDTERLMLLRPKNPLVYHEGEFHRVVDYVRNYKTIYPGAFNPPTKAHVYLEKDCLYEVTQKHHFKAGISADDLLHRIKMLDLENKPTLLTQVPLFIDKYNLLMNLGADEPEFLMGADIWNMLVSRMQYPKDSYLDDMMPRAKFAVMRRDEVDINTTSPITNHIDWKIYKECDSWLKQSSTKVRNCPIPSEHEFLTSRVAQYIKQNRLYE
jgi:nicotinic acid mononucleotide adenylyltransferase